MKVAIFSTKRYDRVHLDAANADAKAARRHQLIYLDAHLAPETVSLAAGAEAVCVFVNDRVDAAVLAGLADLGIRAVVLRSAGYNNVDLASAERLGIAVGRVPAYSPHAVAEHTIALMLCLNRKIHRAYARVREGNFELDGLLGFDMRGRTAGIVGTGKIGLAVARILAGFGCGILAADLVEAPDIAALGGDYVSLDELLARADIVSLHCPLTPATHHLIDRAAIDRMKPGVMLINTSRGGVIDTGAVIEGLKSGRIGWLGLDVYEEEADLFFEDLSGQLLQDDAFARLLTFPNVIVTGHQAFFTEDALRAIAETTIANLDALESTGRPLHALQAEQAVVRPVRS